VYKVAISAYQRQCNGRVVCINNPPRKHSMLVDVRGRGRGRMRMVGDEEEHNLAVPECQYMCMMIVDISR